MYYITFIPKNTKTLIMKVFDITIYQLAILWFSGSIIVLLGALLRGGGRLVLSYLHLSILLGPLALVILLFERRKTCPFCQQVMSNSEKVCPNCDHRLVYAES